MTAEPEKLTTIRTRTFRKVFDSSDGEEILNTLVYENFTGRVIFNMSQGGFGPVEAEEKLKPPS